MDKVERSESMERSDLARAETWGWEDALARLEKLSNDGHDFEISEEQIRDNHSRQEDELLALDAIYQDSLEMLDKQNDLLFFQIYIHCDVPEGFKVSAKFHSITSGGAGAGVGTSTFKPSNKSDIDLAREGTSDEGFVYSFKVNSLPPIVLTCMLPKSYPSHHTPYFTIGTQWLNSFQISSICATLDSIWDDQLGQEVIFQWTEWLHSSALPYLGFGEELVLTVPDHVVRCTGDIRAITVNGVPEQIIPFMISYNEEKCHQAFLNNMHLCVICFSEYLGSEFIKLPCHHLFCSNCMETYSRMHVKEGSVTKILCPERGCGVHVPPMLLKGLLDNEDYERWETLLLQRTLDAMDDVVYCPRCETACLQDSKMNDAQCSKCYFNFCTICKDRRHVGEKCMDAEAKLSILQEQMKSGAMVDELLRKQKELMNELLSAKEVLRDARQCPGCKIAISRTAGCNKMVCSNCGQFFCYRCSKAINGYDHFENACALFSEVATVRVPAWEPKMNERQVEAQVRVAALGGQGLANHPCPNCRQNNVKVGNNNHIFCWACQSRYCALCHMVVRRISEHFSRKGCNQHSDDP